MAKPSDDAPVPPHNLDAEESVLGAMMLSETAVDAVADEVTGADFYRASHGRIFDAAVALRNAGSPVDAITVADRLDSEGVLAEVGGTVRLHELAALVPAAGNARHYARIVREAALLRGLTNVGEQISRMGWDRPKETPEMLSDAEELVLGLAASRVRSDFATADQAADEAIRRMEELAASDSEIVGVATGFRDIDALTLGLRPGQMIVVAGRPSMGKTGFALGIVHNAIRRQVPAAVFTFEMSRLEVMERLVSMESNVDTTRIQSPKKLGAAEWQSVFNGYATLAGLPLYIEDTKSLTMLDVRSRARRLKRRVPALGLVVIDYLQLMRSGSDRWESTQNDVATISRDVKLMAFELGVPVVALSQLSRQSEHRHDHRPTLADLRDSGAIEQDADVVMLLYRAEYYMPENDDVKGIAEVDVAKQRNGPVGMRKLAFVNRLARFSDLAPEGYGA